MVLTEKKQQLLIPYLSKIGKQTTTEEILPVPAQEKKLLFDFQV